MFKHDSAGHTWFSNTDGIAGGGHGKLCGRMLTVVSETKHVIALWYRRHFHCVHNFQPAQCCLWRTEPLTQEASIHVGCRTNGGKAFASRGKVVPRDWVLRPHRVRRPRGIPSDTRGTEEEPPVAVAAAPAERGEASEVERQPLEAGFSELARSGRTQTV